MVSNEEEPFVLFFAFALQGMVFFQFLRARRLQATVIPGEFHGWHFAAGREVVVDDRGQRVGLFVAIAGTRLHAHGRFQIQHAKNCVKAVGAHVAQGATTKIGPTPPHKGQVSMVERTLRRRAQPKVPI